MPSDIRAALDDAVRQAQATFQDADKSALDHGHAFVKGIDGRTRLAREMKKHPKIDVSRGGYHGTVAHIDGVARFYTAQRGAYDAFVKTLQEHEVSGASDLRVWARRD